MCRISSLQMMMMVVVYVKGLIGFVIMMLGVSFINDINLSEAFTTRFREFGSGLVMLGIMSGSVVVPMRWAVDRHNRAMIVFCFFIDLIVFVSQIHLGKVVTSYTYPDFPPELQLDCLLKVPVTYTPDECSRYFESDRVSGMRLYWDYYYSDRGNKASFQKITSLEGDLCCGFFAPFSCIPNSNPFPLDRDTSGIEPYWIDAGRVRCGHVQGYYPVTDECLDYSDLNTVPPTIGGCVFDLGLGYCLERELSDNSLGCASFVEDAMAASIATTGVMLVVLSVFNLYAMLISCCMWWKRKETDVFPSFAVGAKINVLNKETNKPELQTVDFHKIQTEFEVKPAYEVLAKRKFLPMPRHLKVELARQKEEAAVIEAKAAADREAFEDDV